MPEPVVRLLIVAAIVAVASLIAWMARRGAPAGHPPVELERSGLEGDVVIFTSTECPDCRAAIEALRAAKAEYREVTWELEPQVIAELGVVGVPLIVVRGRGGETVGQIAGVPRRRALAALLDEMGG